MRGLNLFRDCGVLGRTLEADTLSTTLFFYKNLIKHYK